MDLWVVAAATGAGYLAKYWQNLSGEKDGLSESSMYSIHKKLESQNLLLAIGDPTHPLDRSARKKLEGNVSSEKADGKFQEVSGRHGGYSAAGVASTSGNDGNILANTENYGDYDLLSLSSLPLGFSGSQVFQENMNGIDGKGEYLDNSGHVLHGFGTKETSSFKRLGRNTSVKRRMSRMYLVKPLNSLESYLTSQLNEEHGKVEETVYIVPPLSTPTVRPLLVTDGSQIIHRAGRDSFDVRFDSGKDAVKRENGIGLEENNNTLLGAQSPQPIGLVKLRRKPEQSHGKGRLSRFGTRASGGSFHSQEPPNGMLLFFIGITIGIVSTVVANKREVDKLNGMLKQTENLVQDLHDELEMKEMLNVKELANEDYQSPQTDNHSSFNRENIESSEPESLDEFIKYNRKKAFDQKAENPELMSKIEAELEAELERLELNMKASSLERISDFVELDPDFQPDVVQGDLKLDVARRQPGGPSDSDDNASGTSTTHIHTANYAVSPRELSLRLHEVIESRLEARIEELEMALQNSHQRVLFLESQNVVSSRGFAYSEVESSSTPKSPTFIGEENDRDRPFVIYAYDEAYGERNRLTEMDQVNENEDEAFVRLLMRQMLYSMDNQPMSK